MALEPCWPRRGRWWSASDLGRVRPVLDTEVGLRADHPEPGQVRGGGAQTTPAATPRAGGRGAGRGGEAPPGRPPPPPDPPPLRPPPTAEPQPRTGGGPPG